MLLKRLSIKKENLQKLSGSGVISRSFILSNVITAQAVKMGGRLNLS
ncbi:MAG: hypothetical protein Q7S44_00990 [bacterium]|nr:hypothetical protein [bacterium]